MTFDARVIVSAMVNMLEICPTATLSESPRRDRQVPQARSVDASHHRQHAPDNLGILGYVRIRREWIPSAAGSGEPECSTTRVNAWA